MGFLDAFVRGAAGPGLMQVGQMQQRQQELEAATAQREKDRQDDRDFRLQLARENNGAREDLATLRAELKGGKSGSRSGGGGGTGGDTSDEDAQAIEIARRMKTDLPTARKYMDRFKNGSTGDPQVDAYMNLSADVLAAIASSMQEGPARMKAKPDDLAKGDQLRQQSDAAQRYGGGDMAAGREGLMLSGKSEYGNAAGSSELTGVPAKGSVAQSQVNENNAQAAKAREGGGTNNLKLPPAVKEQVDNLDAREKELASAMTKAQADGNWNPDTNPGQKQLQANLVATRLKKEQLLAPYMPKGAGGGGADPLGLGIGSPAPAPSPKGEPPKKPADAPKGGMLDGFADKVGSTVEAARKEGASYQRIYARWREAGNGGTPLTAEEKAEAKRFGLPVKG